jgi:hypothetical protein
VSEKVMTIIDGNLMIDYAYPCMMAEKALKEAHHAMLERQYDEAIEKALTAMAETKLMITAIRDMKEHQDAIYKQAASV